MHNVLKVFIFTIFKDRGHSKSFGIKEDDKFLGMFTVHLTRMFNSSWRKERKKKMKFYLFYQKKNKNNNKHLRFITI